ncbi:unnamed protein product [Adineta steineri]|uniref:RRM domain-containing protein n=1 Tax=Adineta steineri TaxID=433720 RepID=A0A813YD03_9BILA|nr:unnamed protein product [Adineta steineri]
MNSPSPPPYGGTNSRRARYSRSPVGGIPPSKRSKPSNSIDPYDHNEAYLRERSESYTSICVKRINPKISDMRVRELCEKKFAKYGSHSVKIYRRSNERVAFVNFTNADDARRARQAKSDLTWEGTQVFLDPVFYRKTVPASRPISPGSVHERFTSNQRSRHRSPQRPSSPLITSRSHSYRQSSSRRQRSISAPPTPPPPPPPPPPRSSRRHYSPYIPVPPDLNDYTSKKSSRQQQQRSSPSPVRRHHNKQRSRSPNIRRIISAPAHRVNSDKDIVVQQEPSRILFIENLERNITESTLKQLFNRYGFIEELYIIKSSSTSKRVSAVIKFENMEMAYRARQAMDGHLIGETVSKIGYGV